MAFSSLLLSAIDAANLAGDRLGQGPASIPGSKPRSRIALDDKYIGPASRLRAVTSHQLRVAVGPAYFNPAIAAIGPTKFAQSSQESSMGGRVLSGRRRTVQL